MTNQDATPNQLGLGNQNYARMAQSNRARAYAAIFLMLLAGSFLVALPGVANNDWESKRN